MRLRAESVSFGYGRRAVLDGVTLDVAEGELLGLVGPNGAGKSTLLRCLYGVLRPVAGRVLADDADLARLGRREVARLLGVVPQHCTPTFPVPVDEFVGMGRYARERFLGGSTPEDRDAVRRALGQMGLSHLAARPVDELSGGEFRRVLVAQALAQEPSVLLLDEPVQQLDLLHVLEVMEFARAFSRRPAASAVVVLHDLSLAARYCDRLALLHRGRIVACGAPEDVLTPANVRDAYGVEASIRRDPSTGTLQVVPLAAAGSQIFPGRAA
jgi:iron complex transport system ATP-binding protein